MTSVVPMGEKRIQSLRIAIVIFKIFIEPYKHTNIDGSYLTMQYRLKERETGIIYPDETTISFDILEEVDK